MSKGKGSQRLGQPEQMTPEKQAEQDEQMRLAFLAEGRDQVGELKCGRPILDELGESVRGGTVLWKSRARNDVDKTGYAGVAYSNPDKKEIIIASAPSMVLKDFRSISSLYHGLVPNQFEQSLKPFLDSIIKELGEDAKGYTFTLTGFSLGAALSDLGAAYLHERGFNVVTHGVDNPGTGKIYEKVKAQTRANHPNEAPAAKPAEVHNYILSEQNVANSVNPQRGKVHTIGIQGQEVAAPRDRIFNIWHLLSAVSGFTKHNTAEEQLRNVGYFDAHIPPEGKQNKAYPIVRKATTCLIVPILASVLLVPALAYGAYIGAGKLKNSIKEYWNRPREQEEHRNFGKPTWDDEEPQLGQGARKESLIQSTDGVEVPLAQQSEKEQVQKPPVQPRPPTYPKGEKPLGQPAAKQPEKEPSVKQPPVGEQGAKREASHVEKLNIRKSNKSISSSIGRS